MNDNFIHCEDNNTHLTLHDCIAEKVYLRDGVLVFEFPDGFWIGSEHPDNPYKECLRTDASRVEFVLENGEGYDAFAWLFVGENRKSSKKTVRNWDFDLFMKKINSGKCAYEFFEHYANTQSPTDNVIEGELRGEGKLNFAQCWLRIWATKVYYYWNNVRPDRPW
ncbi:MAG: hypothetical protein IKT37_04010 [Clostridia bacterium]|nr:hypothetical protein [Clostridia bacterium]